MSDHLQKIQDVLTQFSTPNRHSYFQLRSFNINTEPTTQGRLRRCLLELQARHKSLMEMTLAIEDIQDQLEVIGLEIAQFEAIDPAAPETAKKIAAIEIRRRKRRIESQRIKLAETQRIYRETLEEALFFVSAFETLERTEPLLPYDDPKSQVEYWDAKYKEEILYRKIAGLPLEPQLIKEVLSLPDASELRQKFISTVQEEEKHLRSIADQRNDG